MAPISRTAFFSLLLALTVSSPALALPSDVSVLAGSSIVEYPDLSKRVASPQQGIGAPAATVLPGPPGLPNPQQPTGQQPAGQQPAGGAPPQGQAPGGSPPQQGAGGQQGQPGQQGQGGQAGHGGQQGKQQGPPGGPFMYIPSFSVAIAATIMFFGSFVMHTAQFIKYKTWFAMLFPQAVLAHVIACIARTHAIINPPTQKNMTAYIVQKMCFDLVPSLIGINMIMIFTRVVWWVTPNEHRNKKTLGLPIHHISFIWACGMALPDMVKGVAGNLGKPHGNAQPNPKSTWNRVQQICLVIQFFSITGWTIWCALFMRKANKWIIPIDVERAGYRMIGWATVIAGCFLSWRILYLTLEFDAMYNPQAFISQHEWLFWFAGQLPMFSVYTIYNVAHPGQFFPREYTRFKFDTKKLDKAKLETWPPAISRPIPSDSPTSDPIDSKGFEVTMSESVPGHPGKKV